MTTAQDILDQAAEHIEDEKRSIRREREAFESFRETVSRSSTASDGVTRTGELLEAYRETVMSTPDFEVVYGESISDNLEAEFTPSLAKALQREVPVKQRLKRDLLVATNTAVEQRREFMRTLEAEEESIRSVRETVVDIKRALRELPDCSLQSLGFGTFFEVWETCERFVKRCDCHSETRQRHIANRQGSDVRAGGDAYALNGYLYGGLRTQFPVLYALAETRRRIEQYRGEAPLTGPRHVSNGSESIRADGPSD